MTSANSLSFDGWTCETLHRDYAQCLREDAVLFDSKTDHQRLRVIENAKFGRVLTLDGVVQTTSGDEFIYHEMLTHVPILAHGAARKVLVIGGGDGGMVREILRHKNVERVVMVEIDAGVVDFSKKHLPMLSDGAFDDARLELVIADGADFVRTCTEKFDVVISDSTDPIGPGEVLFTDTFYGHVKSLLAQGGVFVTQNGVPFVQPTELQGTMRAFRALYQHSTCYLATVPTYAGGPMAFGWASDSLAPRAVSLDTLQARFAETGIETKYYTPEVHLAAFALPVYVSKLVNEQNSA